MAAKAAPPHGATAPRKRRLTLPGLVAIIFYSVCGGPFGSEDVVKQAGPLLALLGFLILPFVWSVPEALVTAELATAFPGNAGFVAWVTAAFGPAWGFLEGYLSWVSAATDSAIYPVLFCEYLKHVWPAVAGGITRKVCVASFCVLLSAVNFTGVDIAGWSAFVLAIFTLLPFLYIVPAGLVEAEPSNFLLTRPLDEINWSEYLSVLFWNLNYWDSASTLAGEVRRPASTFPSALRIALPLVLGTYLLPIATGVGLPGPGGGKDWEKWENGYLAEVGARVGGQFVKVWVVAASAVSNVGQYLSEQAEASHQLQGMAELGWLPICFERRSMFGTPTAGLLLVLGVSLLFSMLDFSAIVDFVSTVYCEAQLLEFAAFIQLRRKHPELHRPYRLPLASTAACTAMLLPASALALVLLVLPAVQGDWAQVVYLVVVPVKGVLLYMLLEASRINHWVSFACEPPRNLAALLALGPASEATEHYEDSSSDLAESSTDDREVSVEDSADTSN